MPSFSLKFAGGGLKHFNKTLIMAILNATPDSFSDGGELSGNKIKQAIKYADIIDIGGESTRPGARPVTSADEISRVLPAIKAVRRIDKKIPISIDTQKASVALAAIKAGASFINDVSALSDPNMPEVVKSNNCSIVLMRSKTLKTPVIQSCSEYFQDLLDICRSKGIDKSSIIFDPGLGFGDLATADYSSLPGGDPAANIQLILGVQEYAHNLPVLIGASRKRFLGTMSGENQSKKRDKESLFAAKLAEVSGAAILRVHNPKSTREILN